MRRGFLLFCIVILLSGCSVGMAMSGKSNPNLGLIKVGSTRGEVELHLGLTPIKTVTNKDGTRIDVDEYEIGNEPSAARAIGHGVMDVLTLGLWELIGTPIEGFQGDKYRLIVVYDSEDRVRSLNRIASKQK